MRSRDYRAELARIEQKLDLVLDHLGIEDPRAAAVTPELRALVRRGQKVAAIKEYRAVTGEGLREAKSVIDAIARGER